MSPSRSLAYLRRNRAYRRGSTVAAPLPPATGDPITVVIQGDGANHGDRREVHAVVVAVWTDETGQAITRLVVREVR